MQHPVQSAIACLDVAGLTFPTDPRTLLMLLERCHRSWADCTHIAHDQHNVNNDTYPEDNQITTVLCYLVLVSHVLAGS